MPTSTADGWPYIQPSDLAQQYPVTSQALADLLEARWDTYQTAGTLAPVSGWADFGSTYGGLLVTRSGGMVTIEGMLKRTGADVAVGSTPITVAINPDGFRPCHDITVPIQAWTSGGYPTIRGVIYGTGDLRIQAMPGVTIATGGWVSFVATYRGL